MSHVRRRRRRPDELRGEAIAAARTILLEDGPASVTLQSVAGALEMAHGSITHHFGSAANLQAALADALLAELLSAVRSGTADLRAGLIREPELVDLVFDAFERNGSGRLIAWLAAQDGARLATLYERFARLPAELLDGEPAGAVLGPGDLPPFIAAIVISAFGASLIGDGLSDALGLSRTFMRERLVDDLVGKRTAAALATTSRRDGEDSASAGPSPEPSTMPWPE